MKMSGILDHVDSNVLVILATPASSVRGDLSNAQLVAIDRVRSNLATALGMPLDSAAAEAGMRGIKVANAVAACIGGWADDLLVGLGDALLASDATNFYLRQSRGNVARAIQWTSQCCDARIFIRIDEAFLAAIDRIILAVDDGALRSVIDQINAGIFNDVEKTARSRRSVKIENLRCQLKKVREDRRFEERFGEGQRKRENITALKAKRKMIVEGAMAEGITELELA